MYVQTGSMPWPGAASGGARRLSGLGDHCAPCSTRGSLGEYEGPADAILPLGLAAVAFFTLMHFLSKK